MVEVNPIYPEDAYAKKNPLWDRTVELDTSELGIVKDASAARCAERALLGNGRLPFDEDILSQAEAPIRYFVEADTVADFEEVLHRFTETPREQLPADKQAIALQAGKLAAEIRFANQAFEVMGGIDLDGWANQGWSLG